MNVADLIERLESVAESTTSLDVARHPIVVALVMGTTVTHFYVEEVIVGQNYHLGGQCVTLIAKPSERAI